VAPGLVLVTGGTGFIAAHCIVQLLNAGYRVRTTLRSLARAGAVETAVAEGGADPTGRLSFAQADLTKDEGWDEAVSGCEFVLHVASPFPLLAPRHKDELIVPAREGALRVLRAARDARVKRVVLTSSFAAIGYGQPAVREFTEHHWTDPTARVSAYVKSKTLAERAAWDFVAHEGGALELAVVNPVAVFGPALGTEVSASVQILQRLLSGGMPRLANLSFGVVDVRDVADLHLRAMTDPAARGQRFLAVAGDFVSLPQVAALLKDKLGAQAARVPTKTAPDWAVRLAAVFIRSLAALVPELGKTKNASSAKARDLLEWKPRSAEEALLASAESLFKRWGAERDSPALSAH